MNLRSLCQYPNGMSPLVGIDQFLANNNMNTVPQKVTSRYVRTLLTRGKNDTFYICSIRREYQDVDNVSVGTYYIAIVNGPVGTRDAVGVTVEQSVKRSLEKHGVTFR